MPRATKPMMWLGVLVLPLVACSGHPGVAYHGSGGGEAAVERGLSQMRTLVGATVKDPDKAKQAQELVEAIVAEARVSTQQQRKLHEQLYALNTKYDATPEDFLKVLDELSNSRMKAGTTILGLRFKLKELMTAEEWAALAQGLNDARGRYRRGA